MLIAFEPAVYAQYEGPATSPPANVPAQAQPAFSQQELDQMLAPIALYPDQLLSQILMASTYPLEVVEAARWSRANPDFRGDDAVRAVQQMNWDPSVKSLVAFPQILQVMDEKLDWTERLGDAFLAQEQQVMDTVQHLRQKAYDAGDLRSNDQMQVEQEGQTIIIEPANPEIVYVPYYDPNMVYGPWWWPAYPPIYWAPWPDYYVSSGFAPGFAWGIGITIATGFFFGDFDWDHHSVNVINANNYYYSRREREERNARSPNTAPGVWHHNPEHRRGVPYREAYLRQHHGQTSALPEQRRNFRGYDQFPSFERGSSGNRLNEGNGTATVLPSRPEAQGIPGGLGGRPAGTRPEGGGNRAGRPFERGPQFHPETQGSPGGSPAGTHPEGGGNRAGRSFERGLQFRPVAPGVASPSIEVSPPALQGIGRGPEVRNYSSRGRASYEGAVRGQGRNSAPRPSNNTHGGNRMQHPGN
jgi:Protein of unknown function (DUF3300)